MEGWGGLELLLDLDLDLELRLDRDPDRLGRRRRGEGVCVCMWEGGWSSRHRMFFQGDGCMGGKRWGDLGGKYRTRVDRDARENFKLSGFDLMDGWKEGRKE